MIKADSAASVGIYKKEGTGIIDTSVGKLGQLEMEAIGSMYSKELVEKQLQLIIVLI